MAQHVLFVVTNAAVIGPHNRETGFFFAELAQRRQLYRHGPTTPELGG